MWSLKITVINIDLLNEKYFPSGEQWMGFGSQQTKFIQMKTLKKGHSNDGTFIKRSFVTTKKKPLKAATT